MYIFGTEKLKESTKKNPIELEYYKTCSNKNGLINESYEVYGVEIIKKEFIGNKINTESVCVENITRNETTLDKIMSILKNNSVTPVGLRDVINDLLY